MTAAECIDELRRVIADAMLQSTACASFYDPEVLGSLEVAHKRFRTYMRAAEDAHLGHAVSLLHSLQETRKDTANFAQLTRLLEAESGKPAVEIPDFEKLLAEAKPLWVKVGILRNQVFGHRTAKRSREECFKLAELTPNHLLKLTSLYVKAVNSVTAWRNEPGWTPLMDAGPELKRAIALLGALRT